MNDNLKHIVMTVDTAGEMCQWIERHFMND